MTSGATKTQAAPITQTAPVTINMGDSPLDSILALEVHISSITLTADTGSTVTVLTRPTEIELRHLAGTLQPLSLINVPSGKYTQANITVDSAEITFLNPATGQPVEKELGPSAGPIIAKFTSPLLVGTSPATVNLDFNLAASVSIDASGNVTFSPTITATTAQVPANPQQEDAESGEVEVSGAVVGTAANSFSIAVAQSSQDLTFQVNSSTAFEDLGSLAALVKGMVVEVRAITQQDGTLLATKVEGAVAQPQGMQVEGVVVSTSPSTGPVTQFGLIVRDQEMMSGSQSNLGTTLQVNLSPATRFVVDSDNVSLSNLSFTPVFDAASLAAGQNVEADTEIANTTSITASRVQLKEDAFSGTVSNVAQNGSQATFQFTLAPTSSFAMLTGQSAISVTQQGNTEMQVAVANGSVVRVRGLLFFSSGKYQLVASEIDGGDGEDGSGGDGSGH